MLPFGVNSIVPINIEPPQQPVLASTSINPPIMPANKKRRPAPLKNATEKNKKRKSKKPFEELRRDSNAANGESPMPDSSNIKHLGEIHDEEEEGANGVGGVTENWSDQQTIKVKVNFLKNFMLYIN